MRARRARQIKEVPHKTTTGFVSNNNRFCFKQQQVLLQTTTGFVSARSHSRLTWKLGQGRPHQVDVVFLGEGLADHVAVG